LRFTRVAATIQSHFILRILEFRPGPSFNMRQNGHGDHKDLVEIFGDYS
jgi:hypothetical protein